MASEYPFCYIGWPFAVTIEDSRFQRAALNNISWIVGNSSLGITSGLLVILPQRVERLS